MDKLFLVMGVACQIRDQKIEHDDFVLPRDDYRGEMPSNLLKTDELPCFSHFNYIHEYPVRAGIVEKPEDYMYSRARNYVGLEGLIAMDQW